MIEKKYIDYLINLGISSENKSEKWELDNSLKLRLVSAKSLIERWDIDPTDLIFHFDYKKDIYDLFSFETEEIIDSIYGIKIHFSDDDALKDHGIIFSSKILKEYPDNNKSVCLFPMKITQTTKNNESKNEFSEEKDFYLNFTNLPLKKKDTKNKYVYIYLLLILHPY